MVAVSSSILNVCYYTAPWTAFFVITIPIVVMLTAASLKQMCPFMGQFLVQRDLRKVSKHRSVSGLKAFNFGVFHLPLELITPFNLK